MYSVKDICQRYDVGEATVLKWIKNGQIEAINVGRTPNGKKPRWRVTEAALADFERARTPNPPPAPRPRSSKRRSGLVKFYT